MKGEGLTPKTYNEAVYEVVHHSNIPPKQIADALGVGESTLYNAANPHMDEPTLARKHIIPITRLTRNYAILDYMEHACGRVGFEIPRCGGSFSEVAREAAVATERFGRLLHEIGAALANDGRVDCIELQRITPACLELIETTARLSTAASKEAEGSKR